jgi:glycosyltransferase involved in cell wall biosynthesis
MTKPLVSVIVPTRNSAAVITDCLESIRQQTYSHIELILIDNNSTDATKSIASTFTPHVYNIGPERSAQRNYGARQAKGEFVVMIDSDMSLAPTVIEDCVQKMDNDAIAALFIPEESVGEGFWAKCKRLERSFYIGVSWMEAARFFRRDIYLQLDGYNEQLVSGEDWDLSQRVEALGKIDRIHSFIYHNEGRLRLGETLRKKYYYAKQFAKYLEVNKQTAQTQSQAGIVARYSLFLSKPTKLFKNPFIGMGMLFMKTCEFGFGGVGYLKSKGK